MTHQRPNQLVIKEIRSLPRQYIKFPNSISIYQICKYYIFLFVSNHELYISFPFSFVKNQVGEGITGISITFHQFYLRMMNNQISSIFQMISYQKLRFHIQGKLAIFFTMTRLCILQITFINNFLILRNSLFYNFSVLRLSNTLIQSGIHCPVFHGFSRKLVGCNFRQHPLLVGIRLLRFSETFLKKTDILASLR